MGQSVREASEEPCEIRKVRVVPTLEEMVEPCPARPEHAFEGAASRRCQLDTGGAPVVRIGMPADKPVALELLDLAGHRRGVDPELVGKLGDTQRIPVDVELVEQ